MRIFIPYLIILLIGSSCGQSAQSTSKDSKDNKVSETGSKPKSKSEHRIKASSKSLRDVDFYLAEVSAEKRARRFVDDVQSEAFKREVEEQEKTKVFMLRISLKDGTSVWDYKVEGDPDRTQRLSYFAFQFKDQVKVIDKGKEIPCVLYNLVQTQNLNPFIDILIGFESDLIKSEDYQVVFEDDYFNCGRIKLKPSKI